MKTEWRIFLFSVIGVVLGAIFYLTAVMLADRLGTELAGTLITLMVFGGIGGGWLACFPR